MKNIIILFTLSINIISQAGTVIYAPVSQEAHDFMEFLKNRVKEKVDAKNSSVNPEEGKYIFDGGKYPPHLTLFYAQDDLTMEEVQQKAPGIDDTFNNVASQTAPIDITSSFQNAKISSFQGRNPKEVDEREYKNFKILIVHLAENKQLTNVASTISSEIEAKHKDLTPKDLKFNSHLTIGWLFNEHDINPEELTNSLSQDLKLDIENYVRESKNPFIIKSFILSTHDKLKKEFELKNE